MWGAPNIIDTGSDGFTIKACRMNLSFAGAENPPRERGSELVALDAAPPVQQTRRNGSESLAPAACDRSFHSTEVG